MYSQELHDTGSHTGANTSGPRDVNLQTVRKCQPTGGEEMSRVSTDVGVSLMILITVFGMFTTTSTDLWISPDQTGVSILSYERVKRDPVHPALLVEGVETQPASLGSSREGGVTVGGHDVPGLQELDCNNNVRAENC